ncbi:MAG: ferritin [Chloroflexaceae bacterium]|nr:ferritin [Chloroflexaceae bacterium]
MLSQTIQDAINEQIKDEFYAAHLYLSMSAYFEDANLPGCAKWMRLQSEEEREHAMRFFDYVNDRNGRVILKGLDQPPTEFSSPLEVFEKALAHEQRVTASINNIYALAVKENDYPTQVMLHWFIEEQVEEEKSASEVIELFKMAGDKGHALIMIDRQLGSRKDEEDDD